MAELNWSDVQWQKVSAAISETFAGASVASAFLPTLGPLAGSAEIVRNERLRLSDGNSSTPPTLSLDRDHSSVNVKLINVTVRVELTSEQIADESLTNALLLFRRAASMLAQEEDEIVFEGLRQRPRHLDSKFVSPDTLDPHEGLADLPRRIEFDFFGPESGQTTGQAVISMIVQATQSLEAKYCSGPFACILGSELFSEVHNPSSSLVLPADRIAPLLKGGPLLRATRMYAKCGIVVSLSGNAVDIVVGTPPTAQFLQRTPEGRYLFRVYQRFALRIRDERNRPIAGFRLVPEDTEIKQERSDIALAEAQRNTR